MVEIIRITDFRTKVKSSIKLSKIISLNNLINLGWVILLIMITRKFQTKPLIKSIEIIMIRILLVQKDVTKKLLISIIELITQTKRITTIQIMIQVLNALILVLILNQNIQEIVKHN